MSLEGFSMALAALLLEPNLGIRHFLKDTSLPQGTARDCCRANDTQDLTQNR